ncbi:MAG TPA: uroporphyrinogen-III synthase [Rudaea sp.]|jgi:uroporphyrinogen-III synthase|nr:uroporphyrinogen-III synthase [Rudaea sp.]
MAIRAPKKPSRPVGPLSGASVIVTRPSGTAAALRRRVQALGGNAVGLPGIALRAVPDGARVRKQLRAAERADIVIFTSPAAVRFAFTLLPRMRLRRTTQACVVGSGSARALRRRGVNNVTYPPGRRDSEGLLELPLFARLRHRHVAVVGAPGGRDLLPRELRARGAEVELVNAYERARPRLDRRHLSALETAPTPLISLFSSADALTNLHAMLSPALFAHLVANDCVVSSARIAEIARTLGFSRVHVAASAEPTALLDRACIVMALHRL